MEYQSDFNDRSILGSKRRKFFVLSGGTVLIIAVLLVFQFVKGMLNTEISVNNQTDNLNRAAILPLGEKAPDTDEYVMPAQDKNRFDVLILGIRGKDDPDGGLLTDTIMLLSYDKTAKRSSLISIPRDLYVHIAEKREDKVNTAFENLGLSATKKIFSEITGVYIDNIVVFDFSAFEKIVNALDGIDIVLDKPFKEATQWGYEFSLPAGPNHLDGASALYFARSRFSTSDFDRSDRQQKIILAIKKKLFETDFVSDPITALSLLSSIRGNIQTDMNILDVKTMIDLARELNDSSSSMKRFVLTTDNFLEETKINGVYILLPHQGRLKELQGFFREFVNGHPNIPTPTPAL